MLKRNVIQGYKSLVNVDVRLQPLSILFGPTAAGKSNFLDALQLRARMVSALYPPGADEKRWDGVLVGKKGLRLR